MDRIEAPRIFSVSIIFASHSEKRLAHLCAFLQSKRLQSIYLSSYRYSMASHADTDVPAGRVLMLSPKNSDRKVVIANEVKQSRIIALRLPRTLQVLAMTGRIEWLRSLSLFLGF